MKLTSTSGITKSATTVLLLVGLIASAIIFPYKQLVYAHTFTGDGPLTAKIQNEQVIRNCLFATIHSVCTAYCIQSIR